jgi:hypothetical protein
MLIAKDNIDKTHTTYQCDKCRRLINSTITYQIYIKKPNANIKKEYDVCGECLNTIKNIF